MGLLRIGELLDPHPPGARVDSSVCPASPHPTTDAQGVTVEQGGAGDVGGVPPGTNSNGDDDVPAFIVDLSDCDSPESAKRKGKRKTKSRRKKKMGQKSASRSCKGGPRLNR